MEFHSSADQRVDAAAAKLIFSAELDPAVYAALEADGVRMEAYLAAIARACAGKRVLDVGTGPDALLAIAAANAGATHVTALECSAEAAAMARAAVERASLQDKIVVLEGYSTTLALPRVDVVVHEIVGDIGSEEGVAAMLADLRARPDVVDSSVAGWSVPRVVETLVAPINLRLSAAADGGDGPVEARLPMTPPAPCLLGEPRTLERVDAERSVELTQRTEHAWIVAHDATLTGFVCAPRVELDALSAFDCWTQRTSWRSVLVNTREPHTVYAGDEIRLQATARLARFPVVHSFAVSVRRARDGALDHLGTTTLSLDKAQAGFFDNETPQSA